MSWEIGKNARSYFESARRRGGLQLRPLAAADDDNGMAFYSRLPCTLAILPIRRTGSITTLFVKSYFRSSLSSLPIRPIQGPILHRLGQMLGRHSLGMIQIRNRPSHLQ